MPINNRFPCGEYLPGEEPRPLPQGSPNNLPPLYIPGSNNPQDPFIFIPGVGGEPTGGGQNGGGGGGPNPGGFPVGNPLLKGSRCVARIEACPNGTTGPDRIIRVLKKCSAREIQNDRAEKNRRGVRTTGVYDTKADGLCLEENPFFFGGCVSETDRCVRIPITPGRSIVDSAQTAQAIGPAEPPRTQVSITKGRFSSVALESSVTESNSIIRNLPIKESVSLAYNDSNLNRYASASSTASLRLGLYDPTYNFFNATTSEETETVANYKYLDIFNPFVAREVKYFLDREDSRNIPWHEKAFKDLTLSKVILSINDKLLTAFNNIHNVNNTRVGQNFFLETIRSHLIAGTLAEFDPDYFTQVNNSQEQDQLITISNFGSEGEALQNSLGIFETKSVNPDYRNYGENSIERDNFKRFRVLLEDIETNIPSRFVNGTSSTLYLKNLGIVTQQLESPSGYLQIGDGAGYYISSVFLDGIDRPLQTTNEISSAYYLPPAERSNLLEILGTNADIVLTVSSTSAHELSVDYDPSGNLSPMYFAINLESVGDILNHNSVINIMSATFVRMTNEEAVNHSRNHSFNVVKINLDFRDPFIQYARDTSTILLEQDDFNLRSYGRNRTIINDKIILRNLPAAVILSPGMGSYHNPFNSKSKITKFTGPIVRQINLVPSFDVKNRSLADPPLDVSNTFYTLGTPYFGMVERDFDQDIHGNIRTFYSNFIDYNKNYFSAGVYTSSQPEASFREKSVESKFLIDTLKKLTEVSGVSRLTWWDLYRRINSNDLGKLGYTNINTINNLIANGFMNDIKIYNVLSAFPLEPTGIPDGVSIPDDNIIINESDRVYNP